MTLTETELTYGQAVEAMNLKNELTAQGFKTGKRGMTPKQAQAIYNKVGATNAKFNRVCEIYGYEF